MPRFSTRSLAARANAHPDLQRVLDAAIHDFDFGILESYRGKLAQDEAFENGNSKAKFGQSPHNYRPALAVDCVPYPLDWKNTQSFQRMAQVINGHALKLGVALKWGGTFKSIKDYPHFELANWRSMVNRPAPASEMVA